MWRLLQNFKRKTMSAMQTKAVQIECVQKVNSDKRRYATFRWCSELSFHSTTMVPQRTKEEPKKVFLWFFGHLWGDNVYWPVFNSQSSTKIMNVQLFNRKFLSNAKSWPATIAVWIGTTQRGAGRWCLRGPQWALIAPFLLSTPCMCLVCVC